MGSRGSKGQRGNSHHDEDKGNKGGNGHQSDQHRNHHSDQELDFSDRSRGVVVQTHNGDDSIIGTRRSDIILSGSGDDTVTGGGGHDLLFGGSGIDTAVFSGSVLDYSFAQVGCGPWYVVSGPDGCDFLHRFEVLQFDDAVFTIGSNNAPLAQLRGDAPVGSEDGSFDFAIDLYDLDGGTVSVLSASVTGGATVSVAEGDAQQDAATGSSSGLIVTVDPGAAFAFLGAGETATETVTLVVSDGQGGTTTLTYEVTIEGSNDAPVATAVVATADEDGPAIDIAAAYSDVDATDTHMVTIDTTGTLGSVTDNGDGTFSYDANGAFEALAAGETATDTFTFTVDDGNGGVDTETVTVTIQGANDAPVVAAVSGSTSEDGPAILLSADYSDVDSSDTHTVTIDTNGTLGAVTNNGDGTFSYDANGAFEALAVGETATDTFTYTVDDGNGGTATETVTVTITGTNDAPDVEAVSGSVAQSGGPITLAAAYTDVDGSDTHTVTIDTTGTSGVVTDNGDGTFSYDPAHRWDPLGLGETATDTFTYTVDDGNGGTATETVTVTITGENDDPVAFALSGSVSEDGPATTFEAGYADLDGNDSHTFTVDTTGTLGAVTNNGDGTFSYDANGAFEHLGCGETATDTFTYTVDDGNGGTATETVTVTITGTNDAPEVSGPISIAASEDDVALLAVDLLSNASDAEGDRLGVRNLEVTSDGGLGVVPQVNSDGLLTLDPSAFEALAVGETAEITVSYDVIEADRAYSGSADEPAGGLTNAGTFYVSDSDTGVMYEVERTTSVATQEAALARLAAAGTPVTNGVILLIDENGSTRGVATGSRLITDGALSLADPVVTLEGYTGDIFVDDLSTPPRYVSFLDSFSNGTLTVEVEAPDAGCGSLTHVFTFNDISQDSSNQVTFSGMTLDVSPEAVATTATLTVTGTNDAPEVEAVIGTVDEDAGAITLSAAYTDADTNDSHTITLDTSGTLGAVTDNGDGTFDYDPNGAFEALAQGETATDTFTYTVDDGQGGSATETVTVTINGENDAPIAEALSATVAEAGQGSQFSGYVGGALAGNAGIYYVFDLDTGGLSSFHRTSANIDLVGNAHLSDGNGVLFHVNPNSSGWVVEAYTFDDGDSSGISPSRYTVFDTDGGGGSSRNGNFLEFPDSNENVQSIRLQLDDLTLSDGRSFDVEMVAGPFDYEVNTTDDVSIGSVRFRARENLDSPEVTITADVSDVDGDTFVFSVNDTATLGSVINNGDGTFTYSSDGAFEYLDAGQTARDRFYYTVTDEFGATDTELVTITITGEDELIG